MPPSLAPTGISRASPVVPTPNTLVKFSAVAGALAFLAWADSGRLPHLLCPFLGLTGLPCPFCGMTRALQAWMHGDPALALRFHLLSPLVLAALVPLAFGFRLPGWTWKGLAAAFLAFGLFRIANATL
jgi:hypothetical protein